MRSKVYFQKCYFVMFSCIIAFSNAQDAGSGSESTAVTDTSSAVAKAPTILAPKVDGPVQLVDFIRTMMKKYGEAKAAEAFQSLDQLPLGLIFKILIVEVDKSFAADIVEMQRYAQASDKELIMMIGRIVGGDKNVPKEIFAMDQKLMKFPWWARIRQRMFFNLEKYIAAYSLVPAATRAALNNQAKAKSLGTGAPVDENTSKLAAAVAASATEPSKQQQVDVASPAAPQSPVTPLRISLLTPVQQQQILDTLALAKASGAANSGIQTQQQQQQPKLNPLAQLLFG